MTTKKNCKSKREKLKDFENWHQRANLTQAILKEKNVWDVVNATRPEFITAIQIREKDKNNAVVSKIIKSEINFKLYTKIIREQD